MRASQKFYAPLRSNNQPIILMCQVRSVYNTSKQYTTHGRHAIKKEFCASITTKLPTQDQNCASVAAAPTFITQVALIIKLFPHVAGEIHHIDRPTNSLTTCERKLGREFVLMPLAISKRASSESQNLLPLERTKSACDFQCMHARRPFRIITHCLVSYQGCK
jgi:hypothetical protein